MHYETFHPVALPSTTANLQPQYFYDFTEKPTSVTVSGFPVLAQLDWDGEELKRAGINLNGEDNDGRSLAGFILVVPACGQDRFHNSHGQGLSNRKHHRVPSGDQK
jgi:hypothetical protein